MRDIDEEEYGTDPLDPDSDDDGLCDGLPGSHPDCVYGEDVNGNGVFDPGETNPIDADTDDGGVSDGEEYMRGNDPNWTVDDDGPYGLYGGGGPTCTTMVTPQRDTRSPLWLFVLGLGAIRLLRRRRS